MKIHNLDQGSDEWFSIRSGIPTASCFDKLVTSEGKPSKQLDGYAALLAADLYAGKPTAIEFTNSYMERGKDLEDTARMQYAFIHDVEPERVGFITDDNRRYGCSPDSLINGDGMIEIKCLKTENHVEQILKYKKTKEIPAKYTQQVLGQLFVTGRAWCDLVFYHPDLPMLTIRAYPDNDFFNALDSQIIVLEQKRDEILTFLKEAACA